MFVKTGTAILGANWIILPIYGERMFRVGDEPESAGMLGMSLLLCSRGVGALIGPLAAGRWSGHSEHPMRSGIVLAFVLASLGYLTVSWAPSLADCLSRRCARALRRIDRLGVLYHAAAEVHR